eukprot:9894311-Alexandrium_andersonii.AAC.1
MWRPPAAGPSPGGAELSGQRLETSNSRSESWRRRAWCGAAGAWHLQRGSLQVLPQHVQAAWDANGSAGLSQLGA